MRATTALRSGVPATTMARPDQLQESLVSKDTQRPQHGIGVHAEHGGEILGLRDAVSGVSLTLSDGSPDLGGNLIVERHRIGPIHFSEDQRIGVTFRSALT